MGPPYKTQNVSNGNGMPAVSDAHSMPGIPRTSHTSYMPVIPQQVLTVPAPCLLADSTVLYYFWARYRQGHLKLAMMCKRRLTYLRIVFIGVSIAAGIMPHVAVTSHCPSVLIFPPSSSLSFPTSGSCCGEHWPRREGGAPTRWTFYGQGGNRLLEAVGW